MQAILIGYVPSGQGWVGWVVLVVIVAFLAVGIFGLALGWLKAGVIKWRFRHKASNPAIRPIASAGGTQVGLFGSRGQPTTQGMIRL